MLDTGPYRLLTSQLDCHNRVDIVVRGITVKVALRLPTKLPALLDTSVLRDHLLLGTVMWGLRRHARPVRKDTFCSRGTIDPTQCPPGTYCELKSP